MEKKNRLFTENVSRCIEGDDGAWRELVQSTSRLVYVTIYNTFRAHGFYFQRADADDVFQNVYLKVLRKLSQLREPEKLTAWLRSVSKNQALDWMKKRVPLSMPPEELHDLPGDTRSISPEADAEERELQQVVAVGLEKLPPSDRLILVAFYVEGLKYREIAGILKTTAGGIARRKMLAEGKLRIILGAKIDSYL